MSFLDWSDRFSIKHKTIDEQHKHLFVCINNIYDELENNAEKDKINASLEELLIESGKHFEYEEILMTKFKYSFLEDHKTQHKELFEILNNICTAYNNDEIEFNWQTLTFLRDWLSNHIITTDKPFGKYLEALAIRLQKA